MPSLLVKVQSKLAIHAHEKVRGLLEGQYGSVFKGRSLDFDDLREYIPGDDVKDIDWKATARSGQTRIRRYIAVRKHNILLVVDTGRSMAAHAASGEYKKDVAIMTSGVIGHLAQKHGDLVAMVSGDETGSHYMPLKGSSEHLEHILQHIDTKTTLDAAPSSLASQLEYVARSIRRRMMLVIIADDLALTEEHERLLRRLGAQHELMWITVGDANLTNSQWHGDDMVDVGDESFISPYLRANMQLAIEFDAITKQRRQDFAQLLNRLGIVSERVTGEADVVQGVFRLLERQRYVKRR
ncbi:MAG: DUF58 domain-containing protein [Candidatus Saccharimonas sp.]